MRQPNAYLRGTCRRWANTDAVAAHANKNKPQDPSNAHAPDATTANKATPSAENGTEAAACNHRRQLAATANHANTNAARPTTNKIQPSPKTCDCRQAAAGAERAVCRTSTPKKSKTRREEDTADDTTNAAMGLTGKNRKANADRNDGESAGKNTETPPNTLPNATRPADAKRPGGPDEACRRPMKKTAGIPNNPANNGNKGSRNGKPNATTPKKPKAKKAAACDGRAPSTTSATTTTHANSHAVQGRTNAKKTGPKYQNNGTSNTAPARPPKRPDRTASNAMRPRPDRTSACPGSADTPWLSVGTPKNTPGKLSNARCENARTTTNKGEASENAANIVLVCKNGTNPNAPNPKPKTASKTKPESKVTMDRKQEGTKRKTKS